MKRSGGEGADFQQRTARYEDTGGRVDLGNAGRLTRAPFIATRSTFLPSHRPRRTRKLSPRTGSFGSTTSSDCTSSSSATSSAYPPLSPHFSVSLTLSSRRTGTFSTLQPRLSTRRICSSLRRVMMEATTRSASSLGSFWLWWFRCAALPLLLCLLSSDPSTLSASPSSSNNTSFVFKVSKSGFSGR
jgi:hypothetical protein